MLFNKIVQNKINMRILESFNKTKNLFFISVLLGYYSFGLDGVFIGPWLLHFISKCIEYFKMGEDDEESQKKPSIFRSTVD